MQPTKSTRINVNWHKVVLQQKILPELEIVAKAQAIYDMGMGIPPSARIVRDGLTGNEVVVSENQDFYSKEEWYDLLSFPAESLKKPASTANKTSDYENRWDDSSLAGAIILK